MKITKQSRIGFAIKQRHAIDDYYQGVNACIVLIVNIDKFWTISKKYQQMLIRELYNRENFSSLKNSKIMFSVDIDNHNDFKSRWIKIETDEPFPEQINLENELNTCIETFIEKIKNK